ncbi:MAG TPA: M56 family metallopeptidase [Hymenobacter sp.]|jgi:hypothetical protein
MHPLTTPLLLSWLWQSTLCLGACWLLYRLALHREPCFQYNRRFLSFTPWLALGLPGLLILAAPWLSGWLPTPPDTVVTFTALPPSPAVLPNVAVEVQPTSLDLGSWLPLLYGAGVLLGLARLGWQFVALRMATYRLPREERDGYTLVLTSGKLSISSFGRFVFWDETADLTPTEAQQVLHHELVHVHQRHTWEQVHLKLLGAVLWFNPFIYAYSRALRLTHECLADAAVLEAAPTTEASATYAALLARLSLQRLYPRLTLPHYFAYSQTLTRIAMLRSSSSVRRWKQWLLLPVSAVLFISMACVQATEPVIPAVGELASSKPKVYEHVEQMPVYPGGNSKLFSDITQYGIHDGRHLYSRTTIASQVQGRLIVRFVVAEDGTVRTVDFKKATPSLTGPEAAVKEVQQAALAAVQNLPGTWTPGRHAGKPVPVTLAVVCDMNLKGKKQLPHSYSLVTSWSLDGVTPLGGNGVTTYDN